MPALMYGLFACYAVTGKCDLRIDREGRDIAVFASLDDCQRFGSASVKQPPDKLGKWTIDEGHYYQCFGLTPLPVAPPPEPSRAVYTTTAEALQRAFQANPEAVTQKIGNSIVEITGTVEDTKVADGNALLLAGDSWDVTAWFRKGETADSSGIAKHQRVTLRCEKASTLVAASGRRPAIVEVRDCTQAKPGA